MQAEQRGIGMGCFTDLEALSVFVLFVGLLAGEPPHTEVAQGGVQKREDHLEEPVRENEREDVGGGEFLCQVPEGDELEDGGVDQLGDYGGHVVSDPEVFALGNLAPEGEHEDVQLLGHHETDKRGNCHSDRGSEYLGILLLQGVAVIGLDGDADCHHHEQEHQHYGGHVHEAAGLFASEDLAHDVGYQKQDWHEEDAHGDSYARYRGDLGSQRVDHDHARHEKCKEEVALSTEFFVSGIVLYVLGLAHLCLFPVLREYTLPGSCSPPFMFLTLKICCSFGAAHAVYGCTDNAAGIARPFSAGEEVPRGDAFECFRISCDSYRG